MWWQTLERSYQKTNWPNCSNNWKWIRKRALIMKNLFGLFWPDDLNTKEWYKTNSSYLEVYGRSHRIFQCSYGLHKLFLGLRAGINHFLNENLCNFLDLSFNYPLSVPYLFLEVFHCYFVLLHFSNFFLKLLVQFPNSPIIFDNLDLQFFDCRLFVMYLVIFFLGFKLTAL